MIGQASRRGARRGRRVVCAALVLLGAVPGRAAETSQGGPQPARDSAACRLIAPVVWPTTPVARRVEIDRLLPLRPSCIDSPGYLAVLGALLMEDGEVEEARLWLERSLLLDPDNLGAQADHALALSMLGEPAALQELASSWRGRSDLPPTLRAKLFPPSRDSLYALPVVRLGLPDRRRLGAQGEASLALGYETNLDRSPRLAELTLTIPEGPVVLPVTSRPRSGFAVLGAASAQVAYAPWESTVLRTGLSLNARGAASERGTDWQQLQWATEAVQRGVGWLAQIDGSTAWIGGGLSEPYRIARLGTAGEVQVSQCHARLSLAYEKRVQSRTASLDGTLGAWAADLLCAVPGAAAWNVSVSVSDGRDRPDAAERPGGEQTLRTVGARVVGLLNPATRVDLSWRANRVDDASGYSVLLENDARRRLTLQLLSVQLSHALASYGLPGLTATPAMAGQRARPATSQLFAYQGRQPLRRYALGLVKWRQPAAVLSPPMQHHRLE